MNKTLKGIIAGSAVLAALCGAVVVLKMTEPEETSEESSQTGVSTELWHTHSDDILEVTVDNPNGDSYTAYQKKETMKSTDMDGNPTEEEVSNYYLKGYDELPMNTVDIRLLATRAPEVFSTDLVQEHVSDADLSKYGLDAAVKVTYKVADGENISFLIGGETPVDGCRYLMMDGQDTVYSVSSSLLDPFMKGIHDYLGTALTEAQAEDDDTIIESVRIERKDLDYDFYFVYDPYYAENTNGGSMAVHVMEEPVPALLSADRSSAATHGLYGLNASEVLTPFPTDADKKAAGLDDPFVTVTMKTDDKKTTVFRLGSTYKTEDGETRYYGMLDGLDCIYGFSADQLIYDDMMPEDVISRNVIDMYVWDIGKLECKADGVSLNFTTKGSTQEEVELTKNGVKTDDTNEIERYRKLYSYLLETKAEELVYDDIEPDSEPLAQVHIERQDGKRTYDIAYYDAGNMKAYISVNGAIRFTCRKSYVDTLIENLKIYEDADKELTMTW